MRDNLAATLRLMLVTDDALATGRDLVALCRQSVAGGVTVVQLRLKRAQDHELLVVARELMAVLTVPLIINDRVDVALAAGAAGVHLGPDDLAPTLARRIVPPGFVIGASVGDDREVSRAEVADYWGIGPLHASRTKPDAGNGLELVGCSALQRRAGGRPCLVIGGVLPLDVGGAIRAGFWGVAVASGILNGRETESAQRYAAALMATRTGNGQ
ncbi:MAG TPA: thiamine phosphate synthase [Gemmatimonadales bacterium]